MTVKEGEQVTLVGRTGAGKSTVFRLLLGLYKPEKGSITIGGVDVSDITDSERRACIGCVEQHFSRVPGSVLDQITLGDPGVTREMAEKAARLAGIQDGRDHTAQRKRARNVTLKPQNGLFRSHRRASNVFFGCSPFHTAVTFCHKTYKLPDFSA